MLVRVEKPVVVGPTSRYGEVVVLADAGQSAVLRSERGGIRLLEDNINPQRIIIDDRLVAEPPHLKVGDMLAGPVEGVLHYSYGSYKLLNTEPLPDVRSDEPDHKPTSLTGDDTHLTVATFNLENLWVGSEEEKYEHLAGILADDLGAPDIVAVQEVQDDTGPEDDGTVTAARTLERLVAAIESAGGPLYEARSVDPENNADGGQPGANIRNVFLFNPLRVEFVDREGNPELVAPENPAFNRNEEGRGGSRKPLVGEFRFAGESIILVNLHLRSKGGDDPIFGRRQPRIEGSSPRRTEQARVVADFVRGIVKNDPAIASSCSVTSTTSRTATLYVFETVGLEDLVKRLPLENRYSYVYLGNSQVLDHVLATESLMAGAEIEMVHVNADFPAADRASDHDPVIVSCFR